MRPGRLDKLLYVGPPDTAGRKEILAIRTRGMSVDPALDLDALADLVSGRVHGWIAVALWDLQDRCGGTRRRNPICGTTGRPPCLG
jgi:SpoVK/Ycf46/Vps4 family AAA+-type ATPase